MMKLLVFCLSLSGPLTLYGKTSSKCEKIVALQSYGEYLSQIFNQTVEVEPGPSYGSLFHELGNRYLFDEDLFSQIDRFRQKKKDCENPEFNLFESRIVRSQNDSEIYRNFYDKYFGRCPKHNETAFLRESLIFEIEIQANMYNNSFSSSEENTTDDISKKLYLSTVRILNLDFSCQKVFLDEVKFESQI